MSVVFDALAVGDLLPVLERVVSREDVKSYADASGDQNPLHQDDDFARSAGFGSIIAHGMFTMGHMASCASAWMGDSGQILRISAQFRAPVMIGERIVAGGRVRAIDTDHRAVTLDLWVTLERDGATLWPIKRGAADVRFVG
ncbi:MAG: MaoC family dehydratase N-terminal domain-containing protein [Actinomycetota bacterium]|jgi:acyl dehydratase|nr:MaoC family dehydratase N-terminal domain-containing protein [Actinomycetota bacterium]